jgi:hypothetical protein
MHQNPPKESGLYYLLILSGLGVARSERWIPVTPRIKPLELPLSEEHAAMLRKWMPAIPGIDPLALFRVLIKNPKLSESLYPLGAFQLGKESSLPLQDRELVIDRTCARLPLRI